MTEVRAIGVALITGGAKRIGRATTLELARAGYDAAIHYGEDAEAAETTAETVRSLGRRALILQADLADVGAAHGLIDKARQALGPVTALINNASVFVEDRLQTVTGQTWTQHLDINLRAPVLLAQAFAQQAPAGSAIVNVVDQRVLKPDPRFFSYSLSKSALWSATRTMAQALAPDIRVNAVGPGPTLPSTHQTPAEFAAEAQATLLGAPVPPQAIAEAVRWLLQADRVTGQMIAVDSGQHLGWQTPDILDALP